MAWKYMESCGSLRCLIRVLCFEIVVAVSVVVALFLM
jgi:hypothetical protein